MKENGKPSFILLRGDELLKLVASGSSDLCADVMRPLVQAGPKSGPGDSHQEKGEQLNPIASSHGGTWAPGGCGGPDV
ncbi:hypothetical protein EYF80_005689 [Liparis tanakae]|uniref:Uncharacterized protein n=1 Tax=Liparis tanakae TaxID=230148 RepID=A0A4Z2J3K8_9TELE|nr:hypothetical protein EYF80_005689 [Liparis tanakae]